jgi:type IV pilus assembly protein PilX
MIMHSRHFRPLASPASQRGAALYVAMIMLILLAMIGIVGMQVTGLQEKMSANYRNVNLAFQNAEGGVRLRECYAEDVVNKTNNCAAGATTIQEICGDGFDATNWASQLSLATPAANSVSIRNVGRCITGNSSLDQGVAPVSEDPNPVFQITVYAVNDAIAPSADAAVDTIFRP